MADAWSEALGTNAKYKKITGRLPSVVDLIIVNGNYAIRHCAKKLQAQGEEVTSTSLLSAIEILPPPDFNTVIMFTRPSSVYGRYHEKQLEMPDLPAIEVSYTEEDFITGYPQYVDHTCTNVVVFDKSDMTLLSLLHTQKADGPNYYMMFDDNFRQCIDIKKLQHYLRQESGNVTRSGLLNALFILPLVLLTGVPNLVAWQPSIMFERVEELMSVLSVVGGPIYNLRFKAINRVNAITFFDNIASVESSKTSQFMSALHSSVVPDRYDPVYAGMDDYKSVYNTHDDLAVTEEDLVMLPVYYLSALVDLYHYFNRLDFVGHCFIEAPLASDISALLMKLKEVQYISPQEDSYIKISDSRRILNRLPALRPLTE